MHDYATPVEARLGLEHYFKFYNKERFHQSLGYRTTGEVYDERKDGFSRHDEFSRHKEVYPPMGNKKGIGRGKPQLPCPSHPRFHEGLDELPSVYPSAEPALAKAGVALQQSSLPFQPIGII